MGTPVFKVLKELGQADQTAASTAGIAQLQLSRFQTDQGTRQSFPIAERSRNSSDLGRKAKSPVVRAAQGAQGITPPIAKSARDRTFVPSSDRRASAQVRRPSQAQALGDFSKALPAGRQEAADEAALAQSLQSEIHRQGAQSAKRYGDPAHQLLTMRLMPYIHCSSPSRSSRLRGDKVNQLNRYGHSALPRARMPAVRSA